MAPKKRAPFMEFAMEYKKKDPNMTLEDAISIAGEKWKQMSDNEKTIYKNRAKNLPSLKPSEKYASNNVPISQIEREQRREMEQDRIMKKNIVDYVNFGIDSNTLTSQTYYFIMANFFVRSVNEGFIPAEIAVCEYSLKDGVIKRFHSFVNPVNFKFLGYSYEAKSYSDSTHNLPLPPNAKGETNMLELYEQIVNFITSKYDKSNSTPTVYTYNDSVPIINSILEYLKQDYDCLPIINVYPMQYLFFTLKNAAATIAGTKIIQSIHISNAILERDCYEYTAGIACEYHEEIDKSKYCALSYVIRWAYTFSDNISYDLGIKLIPGFHLPVGINLNFIEEVRRLNDTESIISSNSLNTNFTQPKIEKSYNADARSSLTIASNFTTNNEDISKLENDIKNMKILKKIRNENDSASEITNSEISWTSRYKTRKPLEDSFDFDLSVVTENDIKKCSSKPNSVVQSSGRSLLLNTDCFLLKKSMGRGRKIDSD